MLFIFSLSNPVVIPDTISSWYLSVNLIYNMLPPVTLVSNPLSQYISLVSENYNSNSNNFSIDRKIIKTNIKK